MPMGAARLLRSVARGAAAFVALALAAAPAVVDLHVLATSHAAAHDVAAPPAEARYAEACAHDTARHVESGATSLEAPRCALCARRASAQPALAVAPLAAALVAVGFTAGAELPSRGDTLAHRPSPRGPPRA